jgi:hypothetical protein
VAIPEAPQRHGPRDLVPVPSLTASATLRRVLPVYCGNTYRSMGDRSGVLARRGLYVSTQANFVVPFWQVYWHHAPTSHDTY